MLSGRSERSQHWLATVSLIAVAFVAAAVTIPEAKAFDILTYTTKAGSDSDGALAATVKFEAVSGGIEIILTNTETGTLAKGQAISSLSFTVGGGLSAPTAFTELSGSSYNPTSGGSWTSTSGTAFDDKSSASPPNAIDHWGFKPTGSNVLLATAGSPVPGAKSRHYAVHSPLPGKQGPVAPSRTATLTRSSSAPEPFSSRRASLVLSPVRIFQT